MKSFLLLSLACLAVVSVNGDGIPIYGNPPPPHHGPYDESPKPYAFTYGVSDSYTGTNFAHNEGSDGKLTEGRYTVHLPDGRVQTVTYTADHYGHGGYIADVKVSFSIFMIQIGK